MSGVYTKVSVNGTTVSREFKVPLEKTVGDLKEMIKQWCGIDVARQNLYQQTNKLIDTLQFNFNPHIKRLDYDFEGLKKLVIPLHFQVEPLVGDPEFDVSVKSSFRNEVVQVRESDRVADLKWKLVRAWVKVPYNAMKLVRLGVEMKDGVMLSEYYVCPDCEVEVEFTITLRGLE